MNLAAILTDFIHAADELERVYRQYRAFQTFPEDGGYPEEWRTSVEWETGPAEQAVLDAWERKHAAWERLRQLARMPDPLPALEWPERYPINRVHLDTRL
jgi:hypothetical protein